MTDEALDPIPLSALQHWCYCPRQCALILIEQVIAENLFTQRGQALHKRVDDPGFELRDGLRVERALPLFSDSLGLVGKADVVEFLPDGTPYPVEYKHGSRHKRADIAACDDIQLAAQALPGGYVWPTGAGRGAVLRLLAAAAHCCGRPEFKGKNERSDCRCARHAGGRRDAAAVG